VLALPVLVAAGAIGGAWAGPAVSQLHPAVRAAVRVAAEQHTLPDAISDETRAARQAKNEDEYLRHADNVRRQFAWGTAIAAAVFGLIAGGQLITLSRRRQRERYDIDSARCVSCARCYNACPAGKRKKEKAPPRVKDGTFGSEDGGLCTKRRTI